ncbi:hypothetical protein SF83666_a42940 (plasmid) [Sinorhizobium fredii CCBAU 83666]|nr:hypothetical protein SF83666_a42940 [Sinorhizobium fredii CCBAU 83666]
MPAIKNLNFIADMGRMNGALQLAERTGSSPAPTLARHTAHLMMSLK